MSIQIGLAMLIASVAACMDLISEKIANHFIILGWILGLSYQVLSKGYAGILFFISGAVIPIALLFILFYFRMLGPGDVKLLSVLGGIMGFIPILKCMILSFLFGAILSAAFLVVCGNFRQRLEYFSHYMIRYAQTKEWKPYYRAGAHMENIHFSIPILLSIMLYAGGLY